MAKRNRPCVINIEVDPDLHYRFRILTVKRRTTMRAVLNQLIREYLEREERGE